MVLTFAQFPLRPHFRRERTWYENIPIYGDLQAPKPCFLPCLGGSGRRTPQGLLAHRSGCSRGSHDSPWFLCYRNSKIRVWWEAVERAAEPSTREAAEDHVCCVSKGPCQTGWSAVPVRAASSQMEERPALKASRVGSSQADKEYQPGGAYAASQRNSQNS